MPLNLLSSRLKHQSVGQERRAAPETSMRLYSPSSSLLQVPTETFSEQAMSSWAGHLLPVHQTCSIGLRFQQCSQFIHSVSRSTYYILIDSLPYAVQETCTNSEQKQTWYLLSGACSLAGKENMQRMIEICVNAQLL